jgi:hypothetical protein
MLRRNSLCITDPERDVNRYLTSSPRQLGRAQVRSCTQSSQYTEVQPSVLPGGSIQLSKPPTSWLCCNAFHKLASIPAGFTCKSLRIRRVACAADGTECAIKHPGVDSLAEAEKGMKRVWPAVLFSSIAVFSFAVSTPDRSVTSLRLQRAERLLSKNVVRAAQFIDVRHISARPSCEDVEPPEALTTPNPLFATSAAGRKIKVSFIIGVDGRVHSPLILESAGLAGDRRVLQTVRTWRYRPGTCNGVPTETEGKVEFSSR